MSTCADLEQYRISNKTFQIRYENIFIWKISNFGLFQFDINQPICSPLFKTENFFGSTWFLEFYPHGTSDSDVEFASVFLVIKRYDYRIVNCIYSIEILSADGFIFDTKLNYGEFWHDSREGWHNYIETDKLQDKSIIFPDDVLIIRCLLHEESSNVSKITRTLAETNTGFDRVYFHWFIERETNYNIAPKIIECPATSKYLIEFKMGDSKMFFTITKLYQHALKKFAMLKISLLDMDSFILYSDIYKFTLKYNYNFYDFSTSLSTKKLSQLETEYKKTDRFILMCDFFVTNESQFMGTESCTS